MLGSDADNSYLLLSSAAKAALDVEYILPVVLAGSKTYYKGRLQGWGKQILVRFYSL